MAYVVLARWVAKPGEEDAVAAAIDALIEPSRAEPANLVYEAHRDPADPRVFMLYEHFKRHGHGNALPRLADRERSFYETW